MDSKEGLLLIDPLAIEIIPDNNYTDSCEFLSKSTTQDDEFCKSPKQEDSSTEDIQASIIKTEYIIQPSNQSEDIDSTSRINRHDDDGIEKSNNICALSISNKPQTYPPFYAVSIEKHDNKTEIFNCKAIPSDDNKTKETFQISYYNSRFESCIDNSNFDKIKIPNLLFKCAICAFENKKFSEFQKHNSVVHYVGKVPVDDNTQISEAKSYNVAVDYGEKKFKCKKCSFETKHQTSIHRHNLTHNQKYKCALCPYVCQEKDVLKQHKLSHSDDSNKKETENEYGVPSVKTKNSKTTVKKKLNKKTKSDGKQYICDVCPYQTKLKCNLDTHKTSHTTETPFKCHLCPFETKRSLYLRKHIARHSSVKPYSCDVCPFSSADAFCLKVHRMIHLPEKPFKCQLCDYRTVQKIKLKTHSLTHSNLKACKCDLCPSAFKLPGELRLHKRKKHSLEKPSFVCDLCPFTAFLSNQLKLHKARHHEESLRGTCDIVKFFRCELCPYKSPLVANLKKHVATHSTEKPYHCEVCDFKSKTLLSLNIHAKRHTNDGEFKCSLCPFSTAVAARLKRHEMIHSPDKPYKCDLCDYATVQKPKLKAHRMVHFNDKPLKCDLCPFRCKQPTNLKEHKIRHTGEKSHICDICAYRTFTKGELKKHIVTRHSENQI